MHVHHCFGCTNNPEILQADTYFNIRVSTHDDSLSHMCIRRHGLLRAAVLADYQSVSPRVVDGGCGLIYCDSHVCIPKNVWHSPYLSKHELLLRAAVLANDTVAGFVRRGGQTDIYVMMSFSPIPCAGNRELLD